MPVTLSQVIAQPDAVTLDHFDFLVDAIPGGGDSEVFNIRNMSGILPQTSNTKKTMQLHRHKKHIAGPKDYGGSFTARFLESRDGKISTALRNWQNQINEADTNLPRVEDDYKTQGIARVYGADNNPVVEKQFEGLWIESIQPIELGADGLMTYSVTFSFDTFTDNSVG